jgi:hypothetical protein
MLRILTQPIHRGAHMSCTFYVATNGDDRWSGLIPKPSPDATDGPFATIQKGQSAARGKAADHADAVTVFIRGGRYELARALQFGPEDSGLPAPSEHWNIETGAARSVVYRAYQNEVPVLSGGRLVTGFEPRELKGEPVWVALLPDVASGEWNFTQLWVNGRRAPRPTLPRDGRFKIEQPLGEVVMEGGVDERLFTGQDAFRYCEGDLEDWKNISDVEFVALHYWIESRINFTSIDTTTRTARLARKSRMRLTDDFEADGAPYYVENVSEAFDQPGSWYLDRPTGTLYYRPLPDETIDTVEVIAPALARVIEIRGSGDTCAHHLRFEDIQFSHTEWVSGDEVLTATPQAACHLGGAIHVERAHDIVFERCETSHVGSYGFEITGASHDIDVLGCKIVDLGGGGLKVWHNYETGETIAGAGPDCNHTESCRLVRISDCEIGFGGYRSHQAVGVLVGMCSGVQIIHNEIHDFDYSGVSVGWTWGYQESHAYGNLVEFNHIHDIGRGMLSDMGGIYTLGVQPGTRLTHNLIHDIQSRGYGGWGIYNDEGSSHILVENNLVYRTKSNGYNQHYGEDNIVRNNIFAFGGEAQFSRGRAENHTSFQFTNNIVFFDSQGAVLAGSWEKLGAEIDRNLYYNRSGKPLEFAGDSLDRWRERGPDRNSIVENPGFADPDSGDFSLASDSPVLRIGFRPFDLSDVGPRTHG